MAAYVIATDGASDCTLQWSLCDEHAFRHEHLLREAMTCGNVKTLQDLADFLDGTGFLAHLDACRVQALLHINRALIPQHAAPRIYWEANGCYFMLEFDTTANDILYGHLPVDTSNIPEQEIPDLPSWEYVSVKSIF